MNWTHFFDIWSDEKKFKLDCICCIKHFRGFYQLSIDGSNPDNLSRPPHWENTNFEDFQAKLLSMGMKF
jgi:hypothetical protein